MITKNHPDVRRDKARAFSLVLSLTVMAMLLILCVGAAALLSIELRVAQSSVARSRARMNAMVGARIALGEVQRLLGPDQRVSATADILTASSPSAVTVSSDGTMTPKPTDSAYYTGPNGRVVHPRWVGVWHSGLKSNGTPISGGGGPASGETGKVIQRSQNGALYDSRFVSSATDWQGTGTTSGRMQHNSPSSRLLGWLVSGNEAVSDSATLLDPITTTIDATKDVVLVGTGTLGSYFKPADTSSDMLGARARLVGIANLSGGTDGKYAYWVSDEGVKAKVNVVDRFGATQPDASNPLSPGYFRLLTSQRDRFSVVKGLDGGSDLSRIDTLTAAQISAMGSLSDYMLIASGATSLDESSLRANYFNDITFDSKGVLSDPVNGGLKKDMTSFLLGQRAGGGNLTTVSDTQPVLTGKNYAAFSPTYGYISKWLASAPSATATTATAVLPDLSSDDVWALGYRSPDYSSQTQPARTPLITQCEYYFTVAKYAGTTPAQLGFAAAPVITIWNPYPVALPLDGYVVHMVYCGQLMAALNVKGVVSGTDWSNFGISLGSALYNQSPLMKFTLPTMSIPAGASITFSAPPGVTIMPQPILASPFSTSAIQGSLVKLSANAGFFFAANTASIAADAVADPAASWMENSSQGSIYFDPRYTGPKQQLFLMQGNRTVQHAVFDSYATDPGSNPTFTYYHWIFASDSFQTIPTIPAYTPSQMTRARDNYHNIGWRLLAIDDSAPVSPLRNVNYNLFVQNNFRASKFTRYPQDGQSAQRASNTANGGIFQFDTNPAFFNSARTSPLFINSNTAPSQIAPTDVPHSEWGVYSLATLQHCPMSIMQWMPALAVGNSYASPVVGTEASALGETAEGTAWSSGLVTITGGTGSVSTLPAYYSNYAAAQAKTGSAIPLYFYDLSYEMNKELYDSWYVSGMGMGPSGSSAAGLAWGKGATWAPDAKNSANSRFVSTGKALDVSAPLYAAAAGLMLDGAFNVNSTSQAAWIALLSSARGISVPAVSGVATLTDRTPFAHLARPLTPTITSSGSTPFDAGTWAGFRAVSDDEIRVLAAYMVQTVKERGPFLGLSDFVNRRLIPNLSTTPASYWQFTGAIQAAIDRASRKNRLINAGQEPVDVTQIARTADSATAVAYVDPATGTSNPQVYNNVYSNSSGARQRSIAANAANRVVSKAVGAPGYLTQADVLQHIGVALSARSDTFVIRSAGIDDATGTEAAVEITVQRTPDAVVPYQPTVNGSYYPTTSTTTGEQKFGRRFVITQTRWLAVNDL